jgi:hypothetical protein
MKDQGFENADEEAEPKKAHIITFFEPGKLDGAALEVAEYFHEIAKKVCEAPDNTARSAILERLLESRDSVVRLVKGRT